MKPPRSRGTGRTWPARLRSRRHRGALCGLRYGIGGRLEIDRLPRCFGALVLEHAGMPQHDVDRMTRGRNPEISDVVATGPKESADSLGGGFWQKHRLSSCLSKPTGTWNVLHLQDFAACPCFCRHFGPGPRM